LRREHEFLKMEGVAIKVEEAFKKHGEWTK